jgi:hypothetical protein
MRWSRWWPSDITNASQVNRYKILSCIGFLLRCRDGGSDTVVEHQNPQERRVLDRRGVQRKRTTVLAGRRSG